MAPRSSPGGQSPELELACTLLKKFYKDHDLTATAIAFEIDLSRKGWTTRKTSALAKTGIRSLESLLAKPAQQESRGSDDKSDISDSSSLTSVPEHEMGSDLPEGNWAHCQWMKCTKQFLSSQDLLTHVCDDHVGRRKSDHYTLSCGWKGCGYDGASKRNHLVSHLQAHIKHKPYQCHDCGLDFARTQDKNIHITSRKHQKRTAEAKSLSSSSGTLKRKAAEDNPQEETSKKPVKRTKVKQSQQLDGAYTSLSSASSSSSSSFSSSSDSPSSSDSVALASSSPSSSDSDIEVVVKKAKQQAVMAEKTISSSATSSSSSQDSSSSEDSSHSDSDLSTSSSDESETDVSISSTAQMAGLRLPEQDDQAASNSSDTVQGDKKTSPEFGPSEGTSQERKSMANAKKHLGARQTPLAQLSAKATPDSHISNAYISYDYAERAYNDLSVTRGKGFTKEKNKKKRGSYRGGAIDISGGKSFRFDD